jgi:hypothetical protein
MEGLQQQLQKSLAANTVLEEQLKDQERQSLKKDKEIEDLRKAAAPNFKSGVMALTRSSITSRRPC